MPNISLLKGGKEAEPVKVSYQSKIFRHKMKNVYRVVLFLVLLVIILTAVRTLLNNRVYTSVEVLSSIKKPGTEFSTYINYNGNLIVYSRDGISAYDASGTQLWNQTFEMQEPIVRVNGTYVVVGDYKGSDVYIMDETGTKGNFDTNKIIQDLYISEKGIVVANVKEKNTTWIVYSEAGEMIVEGNASMNQSGYPLAISLSPDNLKMGVSYLTSKVGKVDTNIAFYNFGDVGQNTTDHLVSGYPCEDEIIPYLEYINTNDAVGLSDTKMYLFKGKQIPKLQGEGIELSGQVLSVFHNESKIALVFHNTESEDKYRMEIYDTGGNLIHKQTFNIEYQDIILEKEDIIIYNEAQVLVRTYKGLTKFEGDEMQTISLMIPTNKRTKFLIVKENSVDMIELK